MPICGGAFSHSFLAMGFSLLYNNNSNHKEREPAMGEKKRQRLAREARLEKAREYEKEHGLPVFEFGTSQQITDAAPIRAGFHRLSNDHLLAGRLIQKKRSASFWLHYKGCLFPDGAEKGELHALAASTYLRTIALRILCHENIDADEIQGCVIQRIFQRIDEMQNNDNAPA